MRSRDGGFALGHNCNRAFPRNCCQELEAKETEERSGDEKRGSSEFLYVYQYPTRGKQHTPEYKLIPQVMLQV